MRKFISVLVIAMLVLALAAPAFADAGDGKSPAGPTATVEVPKVADAINEKGEKVEVEVAEPVLAEGETVESVAAEATEAAEAAGIDVKDAVAAEVFDVSMSDGTQPDGSVKVTIVRDSKSGAVAAVMYQAEDGSWDSAKFTDNGDGSVTITFEHFCTVVILTKAPTSAPDVKPAAPSGPASPQTGYD